jgi:hypothetical protein
MTDKFAIARGNSGAAINIDRQSYGSVWTQRKIAQENNDKIDEINNLKEQMNKVLQDQQDIKELLIKLLEKNK